MSEPKETQTVPSQEMTDKEKELRGSLMIALKHRDYDQAALVVQQLQTEKEGHAIVDQNSESKKESLIQDPKAEFATLKSGKAQAIKTALIYSELSPDVLPPHLSGLIERSQAFVGALSETEKAVNSSDQQAASSKLRELRRIATEYNFKPIWTVQILDQMSKNPSLDGEREKIQTEFGLERIPVTIGKEIKDTSQFDFQTVVGLGRKPYIKEVVSEGWTQDGVVMRKPRIIAELK